MLKMTAAVDKMRKDKKTDEPLDTSRMQTISAVSRKAADTPAATNAVSYGSSFKLDSSASLNVQRDAFCLPEEHRPLNPRHDLGRSLIHREQSAHSKAPRPS